MYSVTIEKNSYCYCENSEERLEHRFHLRLYSFYHSASFFSISAKNHLVLISSFSSNDVQFFRLNYLKDFFHELMMKTQQN